MDDVHRKDETHDVENPVESPAEIFGKFASQPDETISTLSTKVS